MYGKRRVHHALGDRAPFGLVERREQVDVGDHREPLRELALLHGGPVGLPLLQQVVLPVGQRDAPAVARPGGQQVAAHRRVGRVVLEEDRRAGGELLPLGERLQFLGLVLLEALEERDAR